MRPLARALAAAALAALALPELAAAVPARLTAAVEGGVGGTSAAAGAGASDAFTDLAPEVRLDLALAPAWKLALGGQAAWVHYLRSGQDVLTQSADLTVRFLGIERLELALALDGEHADFGDAGGSLDPPLLLAPTVTSTAAAWVALDARWRGGVAEPFAGVSGGLRDSTPVPGVDVSSSEGAVVAGVRFALARSLALTAAYRLQATGSDAPEFASTSHGLLAALDARLGPVRAGAAVQVRTVGFATGAREDLGRLALSARVPIGRGLELGAMYEPSVSGVRGTDGPSDVRHLATLSLRWRAPEVWL